MLTKRAGRNTGDQQEKPRRGGRGFMGGMGIRYRMGPPAREVGRPCSGLAFIARSEAAPTQVGLAWRRSMGVSKEDMLGFVRAFWLLSGGFWRAAWKDAGP